MPRLGYKRYAAQGGDWGAIVTTCIRNRGPGQLHRYGIHLNMPIAMPDPATTNDLTEQEKSAIAGMEHYNGWDSGTPSSRARGRKRSATDSPTLPPGN